MISREEFTRRVDKYFTPSSPAIENYISRKDADGRFLDALFERGLQIIVYGPTGVGKSSLVLSALEKNNIPYLWFRFDDTINENNFCAKVMNDLGFTKTTQETNQSESGSEAEISAGTKIWKLIDFKGKFKADSKKSFENIVIPYYNEADIDAVCRALQETNCILFLDDVEKTSTSLKKIIAHLGKKLSDASAISHCGSKIIYVGISQEVNKLIEVDSSLRDRLSDQRIEPVLSGEIKDILTYGWGKLKLNYNDIDLDYVSNLCCGYPRYAHWIGKIAAKHAYISGKRDVLNISDINSSIAYIVDTFRDKYQTLFDKATSHKSGLHLREKILYAMASSDDIEVHTDYIISQCSSYVGKPLLQTQISGPLGELKKEKRGAIIENGRINGSHRFTDLMIKPYIRMVMELEGINQS